MPNPSDKIKELIESGKTLQALTELDQLVEHLSSEIQNEVSGHLAQFKQISRANRQGIITREEFQRDINLINLAILSLLDEIQDSLNSEITSDIPTVIEAELPEDSSLEKIIGANNLQQINWIAKGLDQAKSVCRVITPHGKGTGFIFKSGFIMTNNHVIESPQVAEKSFAEFNFELGSEGQKLPSFRYKLSADEFQTSKKLDYSVVKVILNSNQRPLSDWGSLPINPNAFPIVGEHVTIIQHPEGLRKQIAITANQIINVPDHRLHYVTDTMKGSSGSPVFNDEWEVIAIHHAYAGEKKDSKGNIRALNEGILMSEISKDFEGF